MSYQDYENAPGGNYSQGQTSSGSAQPQGEGYQHVVPEGTQYWIGAAEEVPPINNYSRVFDDGSGSDTAFGLRSAQGGSDETRDLAGGVSTFYTSQYTTVPQDLHPDLSGSNDVTFHDTSVGINDPSQFRVDQGTSSWYEPGYSSGDVTGAGSTDYMVYPGNRSINPSIDHTPIMADDVSTSQPPPLEYVSAAQVIQGADPEPKSPPHYEIACPRGCGTVLTGAHAPGNMTRHLKSQTCAAPGRIKRSYPCPIECCTKEYARSDALKVHMRKAHGASPAPARSPAFYEGGDGED